MMSSNNHPDSFEDDDLPEAQSNDDIMDLIAKGTWEMVKSMNRLADAFEHQNELLSKIIQSHERSDKELSKVLPVGFLKSALVRDRVDLKDIEL